MFYILSSVSLSVLSAFLLPVKQHFLTSKCIYSHVLCLGKNQEAKAVFPSTPETRMSLRPPACCLFSSPGSERWGRGRSSCRCWWSRGRGRQGASGSGTVETPSGPGSQYPAELHPGTESWTCTQCRTSGCQPCPQSRPEAESLLLLLLLLFWKKNPSVEFCFNVHLESGQKCPNSDLNNHLVRNLQ